MRVDTSKKLFAGVRIDGRMREQLEKCPQRDRVYFEDPAGRYLVVLRGGDDTYLGKILDPAAGLGTMDDVKRNIWSLMLRVCPGRRDDGEVKLFALGDDELEPNFSQRTAAPRPYQPPGSDRMGSRAPDRVGDRPIDRIGDRPGDRPLDRPGERYSDLLSDRPAGNREPPIRPRSEDDDDYL